MKRLASLTAALFAATALAQTPTATPKPAEPPAKPVATTSLKVGDKAPPLAIEAWVKGDAVTGFEKGKIYVVEFWATWCPPCRESIPHLTHLQKEFKSKGVTIIGVDMGEDWRGTPYSAETLPKVKKFVSDFGEKMEYTIAYDGPNKPTDKAYMQAAGQHGIPTAFVVDHDGTIAWIGSPFEIDPVLEHVVKGDWNDATRAEMAKAKQEEQKLLKDFAGGVNALDVPKVLESGSKLVEKSGSSANVMNTVAWSIVDPATPFAAKLKDNPKLVDLALQAAQNAEKATGGTNAPMIDTLARCYWVKGDKLKAIELQKKAVSLAADEDKADLEKALKEYESGGN